MAPASPATAWMPAVALALASARYQQITPAAVAVRLSLLAAAALSLVAF